MLWCIQYTWFTCSVHFDVTWQPAISKLAQTFFSLVQACISSYKQKRPESTISAKVTCFFKLKVNFGHLVKSKKIVEKAAFLQSFWLI